MSDYGTHAEIEVPLLVDNDFETDADGVCYLVNMIYVADAEQPHEIKVKLDGVIEGLVEFYGDVNGYQQLYSIAHEFVRNAEVLRNSAQRMEDSNDVVEDLFDIPNE